jgi:hypothetical protein
MPRTDSPDKKDGPGAGTLREVFSGHASDVVRSMSRPVRMSLCRWLFIPPVLALLLVTHPWTYLPKHHPRPAPPPVHVTASPSPVTSEADSPASQAAALDKIVSQSAGFRSQASHAVNDAAGCGDLQSDLDVLTGAAAARGRLADQVDNLEMDQVTGGPDAKELLRTALSDSASADSDYVDWVQELWIAGCDPAMAMDQEDRSSGDQESGAAQESKTEFLGVWKPIASEFGLRTWTADQF